MNKKLLTLLESLAVLVSVGTLAVVLQGCGSVPTKTEQKLFTVQTNYVPVTNLLVTTNPDGTLATNPVVIREEKYNLLPGKGEIAITQIGTETGNVFGVGGIVGAALGALFGAWRWFRSSKSEKVANTLAQEIELVREFVKTLPNGNVYDSELVNWIQKHQAEAGVLQSVIKILRDEINNDEAKGSVSQVIEAIESLKKI